jgi:hypothetical protein
MKTPRVLPLLVAALINVSLLSQTTQAATPAQLLTELGATAGTTPSAIRGQQFFNASHGKEWRCASCHGVLPVQSGKHATTGKAIGALAPAANAERFTDMAKTEKWFRRNCNDVVGRECSATEKADVLSWLMTLKP